MTPAAPAPAPAPARDTAVVVFTDAADLPWLRLLRPGFRHCFAVLRRGGAWVALDPLAHVTRLELVPGSLARDAAAVAAVYRALGAAALVVEVREPPRRLAPIRPYTCVEAVKRLIGRRAPRVVTPWQLHRLLNEENKIIKQENILDMARRRG